MTHIEGAVRHIISYMIHRALLGSIERFFGVLIEHYRALSHLAFPVQKRRSSPLLIGMDFTKFAMELKSAGLGEVDDRSVG